MHQLIKDASNRMDKTIEALRSELSKVRTGKATTTLLDGVKVCLLYTSDAADERSSVDLGGRRIIKKKHREKQCGRCRV